MDERHNTHRLKTLDVTLQSGGLKLSLVPELLDVRTAPLKYSLEWEGPDSVQLAYALDDVLNARTLEDYERAGLRRALRACDLDVVKAAKRLGLSKSTMYRHLSKLGVSVRELRQDLRKDVG